MNINKLPNIVRIKRVFSKSDWKTLFPNASRTYNYEGFIEAAAHYPQFCNEYFDPSQLDYACMKELSTFFAQAS